MAGLSWYIETLITSPTFICVVANNVFPALERPGKLVNNDVVINRRVGPPLVIVRITCN